MRQLTNITWPKSCFDNFS